MRYLAALFMASLFLPGTWLIWAAGSHLILQIRRAPFLKQAEGEIIRFEIEERRRRKGSGREKVYRTIIAFQTVAGETIVFKGPSAALNSETNELRPRIGDQVSVIYDPGKKLPPALADSGAEYGPAVAAFFGLVFAGVSLLFFKLFWREKFSYRENLN